MVVGEDVVVVVGPGAVVVVVVVPVPDVVVVELIVVVAAGELASAGLAPPTTASTGAQDREIAARSRRLFIAPFWMRRQVLSTNATAANGFATAPTRRCGAWVS